MSRDSLWLFAVKYPPQQGVADVSCKSAIGQKCPEGRVTRCTDRDGETEETAFPLEEYQEGVFISTLDAGNAKPESY